MTVAQDLLKWLPATVAGLLAWGFPEEVTS